MHSTFIYICTFHQEDLIESVCRYRDDVKALSRLRGYQYSYNSTYIYFIRMNVISMKKLTLLPIGMGVVIAEALSRVLLYDRNPPDNDDDDDNASSCTASATVNVKWPNDVLINKKKVAGVLIENVSDLSNDYWLLCGIGVNINGHPRELPPEAKASAPARLATSLKEHIDEQTKIMTIPTAFDFGVQFS